MCFSKPAFRVATSAYVLLELNEATASETIADYEVDAFPNFAVLDAEGKVLLPPNSTLSQVVCSYPPVQTVSSLLGYHYQSCLEGGTACRADTILQHLTLLAATEQSTAAEQWLQKSLTNPKAKPEDVRVLRVYKALALRRAGKKAEGLALLKEAEPKLTFQEPEAEAVAETAPKGSMTPRQVEPFVVSDGKVAFGRISGDADPQLTAKALTWLSALPAGAGIPAPEGKEPAELLSGAVSLAAMLNKPLVAAPWLAAYKTALGDKAFEGATSATLADGLILLAEGNLKEGARRLMAFVQAAPEETFAPWAGVVAYEAASRAGDLTLSETYARQVSDIYGARLPQDLKERLD